MKYKLIIAAFTLFFFVETLQAQNSKKIFSDAEKQVSLMYKDAVANRNDRQIFPRTLRNDSLHLVVSNDWTSGFFPGMLWFYV